MEPLPAATSITAALLGSGSGIGTFSGSGPDAVCAGFGSRDADARGGDSDSVGAFSLWRWLTAALECLTSVSKDLRDVSAELAALWTAGHA